LNTTESLALTTNHFSLFSVLLFSLFYSRLSTGGGAGKASKMIPSYVFQKLKNEVSVALNIPSRFETSVLTINATDIGSFEPWQQAELFVIKARLLEKMGHLQEAMTSFSHGLTLW